MLPGSTRHQGRDRQVGRPNAGSTWYVLTPTLPQCTRPGLAPPGTCPVLVSMSPMEHLSPPGVLGRWEVCRYQGCDKGWVSEFLADLGLCNRPTRELQKPGVCP